MISGLTKVVPFITKHWYLPVFVVVLGAYLWKKKKVKPENKEANAANVLSENGVKDEIRQNYFTNVTAQVAEGLGTAYSKFDPRYYLENDERVYDLLKDLNTTEFKIVSQLYRDTYAKGRSLTEDLSKLLDDRYYRLLKFK